MEIIQLEQLVQENFGKYKSGKVASYIPALAKVRPDQLGIAIYDLFNNNLLFAGTADKLFAIESISKVPALLLAIEDNGLEKVFNHVKTEPSTFTFNSIMNMEISHSNQPLNPFVNAGAIMITSLIKGNSFDEKKVRIRNFIAKLCDDTIISLNNEVYESEKLTGDQNRSLTYYMKAKNMIEQDAMDVLDLYFWQCSLNVSAKHLAKMAAVLANKGIAPWSQERLIEEETATVVKSLMAMSGMYNESGQFAVEVGVPAKSGVGGGLLATVPNRYGIGIFGPALDYAGNSVAGIALLKDVTKQMDLNIFG